MSIDLAAVRADTPACKNLLHFNNAGASLTPQPVYDAVIAHLDLEQRIGAYEAEEAASETLEDFYDAMAEMLSCHRDEIAYIENATRAWDMAFYSLPLEAGDQILTHSSEYASNYLAYLQQARRRGLKIEVVPSDRYGQIDVAALESMINEHTRLISINHVPTQSGLVNPAEKVGEIASKNGIFYLLDACQAVGQMPVDVSRIKCDLLTGTGRKFLRGPRGTGFLYVRRSILDQLDPPFIDLRAGNWIDQDSFEFAPGAKRFENWESYVAGRVGLTHAVRYALDIGLDSIQSRVVELAERLRTRLARIKGITVRDPGEHKCGIVTFHKQAEEAFKLAARLRASQINISVTTPASARLDSQFSGQQDIARASVHYFNSEEEVERFCEILGR
ncbi:MAG: aminotransferase class V-fold PLP-dependent enzyme [Gammaproteobacteria bacterium]|nr:aminotransferase class V-fold PLP-dependent enzyme [Gammaproteobacteria bacterium]